MVTKESAMDGMIARANRVCLDPINAKVREPGKSTIPSGVPASSQSSLASQWKRRLIFEIHDSITYMQAPQIERYILFATNEDVRSLGFQIQIKKP